MLKPTVVYVSIHSGVLRFSLLVFTPYTSILVRIKGNYCVGRDADSGNAKPVSRQGTLEIEMLLEAKKVKGKKIRMPTAVTPSRLAAKEH